MARLQRDIMCKAVLGATFESVFGPSPMREVCELRELLPPTLIERLDADLTHQQVTLYRGSDGALRDLYTSQPYIENPPLS